MLRGLDPTDWSYVGSDGLQEVAPDPPSGVRVSAAACREWSVVDVLPRSCYGCDCVLPPRQQIET